MSDTNDAATQATAVPSHTGEDAQNDVLLDVQHLTKRFAAETNFFGRATSHVQAVDDVSFPDTPRRGVRPGGRIGLRQDHRGQDAREPASSPRPAPSSSTGKTSRP